MGLLKRQGQVKAWSDREIAAGDSWNDEINAAMGKADIAVLLVSPDFLASDFIMDRELPVLLEMCKPDNPARLRRILPLIVSPCDWKGYPDLKELEVRPKGQDLMSAPKADQEKCLVDFAREVSEILYAGRKPTEPEVVAAQGTGPAIISERSYATLEVRLAHCEWESYRVELSFTWSGDKKSDFMRRYGICLDLSAFSRIDDTDRYARSLRGALFPNDGARNAVTLAKNRADEKQVPLRLRICIEPSARELHSINWEKLTVGDGAGNNPFDASSTSLARYALGRGAGWQPAQIRRNAKPTALLLGTSAGGTASTENAAALDELDEIAQMLGAANIDCTVTKNWCGPEDLTKELRKHGSVDYLYLLICDCSLAENEALVCKPGAEGYTAGDPGGRGIAESLGQLELPPRLVVVAPAITGTRQAENCWPWLLHLANEIVERGVLGVLTQQQDLKQGTWHDFLAPFFAKLVEHGQMDQAALTARNRFADSASPWAPVIVSRLRDARLWYHPHFMDESRRDATWDLLLKRIAEGKCTPVIGPGVDYRIARFRQEMALTWAERYQNPLDLHEQVNLPQVSQYIVATQGYGQLEQDFTRDLRKFALERYGHLLDDDRLNNRFRLDLLSRKEAKRAIREPALAAKARVELTDGAIDGLLTVLATVSERIGAFASGWNRS